MNTATENLAAAFGIALAVMTVEELMALIDQQKRERAKKELRDCDQRIKDVERELDSLKARWIKLARGMQSIEQGVVA